MGKRLPSTPKSKVTAAIRRLWLGSRERSAALKREAYCCEECGRKQSVAKGREVKLNVHHRDGIEWEKIREYIYRHVLCHPDKLSVLCEECHSKEHDVTQTSK